MGTSPSKDGVAGEEGLVIEMRKDKSAYSWTGKWTVPDLLVEQVFRQRDVDHAREAWDVKTGCEVDISASFF